VLYLPFDHIRLRRTKMLFLNFTSKQQFCLFLQTIPVQLQLRFIRLLS